MLSSLLPMGALNLHMIQKIQDDAAKIAELEFDLKDQTDFRKQYREKSLELEAKLAKFMREPFVVVLIDGDGAKFRDDFLRDPEQGAVKAARNLREAVKQASLGHDMPILIRVYASLNDLARSLRLSDVIFRDESMHIFAEHFTNTHVDCDFINVGKGKENTDAKIRRLLDHYHKNAQCHKIFVACCHDNGYLHDLRQYAGTTDNKINLIETTPAEPNFRSLGFPILRFDGVFRSESLNNETKRVAQNFPLRSRSPIQIPPGLIARPIQASHFPPPPSDAISPEPQERRGPTPLVTSNTTSPVQTVGSRQLSAISPPERSPAQSQVIPRTSNVISSGNGGVSISYATAGGNIDHQNVDVKVTKPKKPKYVYYTVNQCRIDEATQHPARGPAQTTYQDKFQKARDRGMVFCNDHYLKGKCPRGANCDKEHEVALDPAEVAIHRYKARTSLCPNGPYCTDYDCYLSHHCPRQPCGRGNACAFSNTEKWGDLHFTKEQLVAWTRWTEGIDFPEYVGDSSA
ncbi:hypothetical protein NPX13_g1204 [Xylaria arbuscula]|uniref:C3H1-type domain-containing protein n=1 Tax=Xylaria arbuscula TaxID=114810 RepID=A0A9W8NMH9_9PEZI|nr:hypothetical protein NPX13_g1204 [Xylaria arbuscula]